MAIRRWLWHRGLGLSIDRGGVAFPFEGDEVIYVWPWRRTGNRDRFVSVCCEGGFPTLLALRCFWMAYEIAERRACRRDREKAIVAQRGGNRRE